jgi:hypothetical protein
MTVQPLSFSLCYTGLPACGPAGTVTNSRKTHGHFWPDTPAAQIETNAGRWLEGSLHPEGPAAGQLDQRFLWLSLVPEQMLSCTACFPCSPPNSRRYPRNRPWRPIGL